MNAAPRLSVGLPVYNGEKYLAESLDALLGQSYGDYKLIISDNASTDGTEEICRQYLAKDSRLSYYRQPVNIGATPNHNWCFEQSDTELFKWASYDDLYGRDLLAPLYRGAGRRPVPGPRARVPGDHRRRRRHRARGRLPARHHEPARAGPVPQPAVRRRRRRLLRRDALGHPAPYAAERQLPPLRPDDHGGAGPVRPVPPGARTALLPAGPPGPGRAGQADHPLPLGEHGAEPGEPVAESHRPADQGVRRRLRRRDPPGTAVVGRSPGVLRPPGALAGRPRGPPVAGPDRGHLPATPPTAIPDSSGVVRAREVS